jgi:arginase family enzyme
MQLVLLHLDEALDAQDEFLRAADLTGPWHIRLADDASAIRLWGKQPAMNRFRDRLLQHFSTDNRDARLVFIGSGDFHHVTTYLLSAALENHSEPVTLIHFDNHPDWVKFGNGIHCGSWINRALDHPQVAKLITIGVCSHDLKRPERDGADLNLFSRGLLELYPYEHAPSRVSGDYGSSASFEQLENSLRWKTIRDMGEGNFLEYLLTRIKTKSAYVTVDKDVLSAEDAVTNWDQGNMRMPYLLSMVREIGRRHTVIGADVTGDYSLPRYTGAPWTKIPKQVEILLDQPRSRPEPSLAANVNSAANKALLEAFSDVMV